MGKITTNIPQLDKLLAGGIEENTSSGIIVQPGIDGTPFLYQLASAAAKTHKVFYVVNSKSPDAIKAEMKSFGFDSKKINFVDAYSALIGGKSNVSLQVNNPKDAAEMLKHISTITKKIKKHLIIIDSFSNLIDLTEKEDVSFLEQAKKLQASMVCLFTQWPYAPAFLKKLRTSFDTIVDVQSIKKKIFSRSYFSVTKWSGGKISSNAVPFRVQSPGGIKIYIPKVLVTGPFNAGKTSFIHSTSQKAVSVDRLGTTIALDHGHLQYGDFTVDLFGTPGQQRFDPILKILGGEALGVIVVVSSTDPQGFTRALEMMKTAQVYNLPLVVAANKANLRGAIKPEQIKIKMKLDDVQVIPVVAADLTKVQPGLPCQLRKEDLDKVLGALFGKLMGGQ